MATGRKAYTRRQNGKIVHVKASFGSSPNRTPGHLKVSEDTRRQAFIDRARRKHADARTPKERDRWQRYLLNMGSSVMEPAHTVPSHEHLLTR